MKKKFLMTALFAVLMSVSLVSCSKDSDASSIDGSFVREDRQLQLLSSIVSCTRGSDWDEQSERIIPGQLVGISTEGAKEGKDHNNEPWTVRDNYSLGNSSSPIYFGDGDISVTAFFPYRSNLSDIIDKEGYFEFLVNSDQSDDSKDGYRSSDLLYSAATAYKTDYYTTLLFYHKLSKINIYIKGDFEAEDDFDNFSTTSISIEDTHLATLFNPSTGKLKETGRTDDVGPILAGTGARYATAIVVPQQVSTGTALIKICLGARTFYYRVGEEGLNLESGNSYTYTFELRTKQTGELKLSFVDVEIEPWKDVNCTPDAAISLDEE